jgi:membrane fusion protein (multidrug efflux system)
MNRIWSGVVIAIVGLCIVLILCFSWGFWPFGGSAWTDDAFIHGDVTIISPKVAGYIGQIFVDDYQPVKAGDPLVKIEDQDFVAADDHATAQEASAEAALADNKTHQTTQLAMIDEAKAKIVSAQAAADRAESDYKRAESVIKKGAVSASFLDTDKAERDQTQAALDEANASLVAAQSQLDSLQAEAKQLEANINVAKADKDAAQLNVGYTIIKAPVDGMVGERTVRVGQYVRPGTQLIPMVPKQKFWVVANYKENQLPNIHIGDHARIRVDALGGERLAGTVVAFSPASGSEFALVPPDNASGNYTKIAHRFGVRIEFDDNQPALAQLRPGMSAEVRINDSGYHKKGPALFDAVAPSYYTPDKKKNDDASAIQDQQ